MTDFEQLDSLADMKNGVLTTADVMEAGITKAVLARFVRERQYERVYHGIYLSPDVWRDEWYLMQLRCPQIIYSHDNALFFHDLTDREPMQPIVTVKTGYNPSRLTADGVKVYTVKSELYELGITEAKTIFGNTVRTYNMERTICDIVRSRNTLDAQIFYDALKQYVRKKEKNLSQLMKYAQAFHVDKMVGEYMRTLL